MRMVRSGLLLCMLMAATHAQALCLLCSCSVSTSPVNFGAYNPIGGAAGAGVGNVEITCFGTLGVLLSLNVAVGKGNNGATYNDRKLASGTSRLQYQLYSDAALQVVWGDSGSTTVGSTVLLSLLSGTKVNMPVYGTLPANQRSATAGSYSDAISVVVTYN